MYRLDLVAQERRETLENGKMLQEQWKVLLTASELVDYRVEITYTMFLVLGDIY